MVWNGRQEEVSGVVPEGGSNGQSRPSENSISANGGERTGSASVPPRGPRVRDEMPEQDLAHEVLRQRLGVGIGGGLLGGIGHAP